MVRILGPVVAGLAVVLMAGSALSADLKEIKARGVLNAATSGNLRPNTYVNEKNELTGFDIEVGRFIEKELGIKFNIIPLDFKGIMPGLQGGRFDAVFSNVNITKERMELFEYSIPYSRSAVVPVVRRGVQGVKSFRDLAGKHVGGVSGGVDSELAALEIQKTYGTFASMKAYPGLGEMFSDLQTGRLDVAIINDLAAAAFIKENRGVAEIVGEPYTVRYVAVPMQKGAVELKAAMDAAIRKMRNSGLLDERAKFYFGIENFSRALIDDLPKL